MKVRIFSWHIVASDKTFATPYLQFGIPKAGPSFFKMYRCTLMQVPLKDNEALCHMEVDFFRFKSLTKVKTKKILTVTEYETNATKNKIKPIEGKKG